jgi:hypothetical protein
MRSFRVFWVGAALAGLAVALLSRADDKGPAKLEPKEPPPAVTQITEVEGKTLLQWIDDLRHEDPSVREKAIRAILVFGPQATIAVPALVDRCMDPESSPRVKAVIALTLLDIQDKDRDKVIEALAKRLEQDDPQGIVRYHAAVALNRFGEEAKAAISGLVRATSDKSSFETRRAAISALRKIARDKKHGPDARATNALLDRLVTGVEPALAVKIEAVMSLGFMGKPADTALNTKVETTLKAYANHREKLLAIWALVSLQALGEVNAAQLTAIAKHAGSNDVETRMHTARALGTIGSKAKTHASTLIGMLNDKDNSVFSEACWALMNMGDPGEKAVLALTAIAEAKDDPDNKVDPGRKYAAKGALEGIKFYEKNKDKIEKMDEKKDVKKDK